MGRPTDTTNHYRVKTHVNNGYIYASTQPPYIDPVTGKKKYRHIHWGTLDEPQKFIPSTQYYVATPEERAKLIFPNEWDMSEAEKLTGLQKPEVLISTEKYQNRLYGDVWLLEQVAKKTGILEDLNSVFNGNSWIVGDILTLSMFPYLTNYTYNRVARWQRITKAPSSRELTSKAITLFTGSYSKARIKKAGRSALFVIC